MDTIYKSSFIYIRDRKVLFVRAQGENSFFLPGGTREEGETDADCVVREVKEELGVDIQRDTIVELQQYTAQAAMRPDGVMATVTYFTGDIVGTPVPSSEIEEFAWLSSTDSDRTSAVTGKRILAWLKENNLID